MSEHPVAEHLLLRLQIPSLPIHLATLSQLLQSRLQLHEPLLALSGRLDLALAQIETRKALAAASQPRSQGTRYVEGESGDESSDEDDVEIEQDAGDGEVEEVRVESRRDSKELAEDEEGEDELEQPVRKAGKAKAKGKLNGVAAGEDVEMLSGSEDG